MVHKVVAIFHFKPEHKDDFATWWAGPNGRPKSEASKGYISIEVTQAVDDPCKYFLWQKWESKADQEAYVKMRTETGVFDEFGPKFASAPQIMPLADIDSAEKKVHKVCTKFHFKDEHKDFFANWWGTAEGRAVSAKSKGYISIEVTRDPQDPATYFLWQKWETKEDQEAYVKMRTDTGVFAKFGPMFASDPQIIPLVDRT